MLFYVEYQLPQMTGAKVHQQGPWAAAEAEYHLRDIAGFEGVTNARLVPEVEAMKRAPTSWERLLDDD